MSTNGSIPEKWKKVAITCEESRISELSGKQKMIYHEMFGKKTPEQILGYLNRTFWRNHYIITIKPKASPSEDSQEIVTCVAKEEQLISH
jgi:hypothetical protein